MDSVDWTLKARGRGLSMAQSYRVAYSVIPTSNILHILILK